MFLYVFIALIAVTALEWIGLHWLRSQIGLPGVVCWIAGTAVLGAILAKRQGLRCWNELNRQLDGGQEPTDTILHALLILLAGWLLILPGLLCDLVGLLLLIPFVRRRVIRFAAQRFQLYRMRRRREQDDVPEPPSSPETYNAKDDIIDV